MKLIAFAGSSSIHSLNKQFATYVGEKAATDLSAELELLDLNDYDIPLYSIDKEKRGEVPPEVHKFISKLKQADGIILSLAEHNGTYTAVFKNLIDWTSRIELGFFQGVPMFLLSTSPGGFGGGNVMEAALARLPKFRAQIVAHFSLPKFEENFDPEKGILDVGIKSEFEDKFALFREVIGRQ
ncbi:MAG: NAD(P)H-dependent oxidoreductase [Crocinitomicaceae bacterium]|nr:NAD(P)H-dependent oxidoreductase [Crocinitomicaceae bacterium]